MTRCFTENYAVVGCRLRKYDIVLYHDPDGLQPFKTICRKFESYDEARQWAANEMHKDPEARSVNVFFHY